MCTHMPCVPGVIEYKTAYIMQVGLSISHHSYDSLHVFPYTIQCAGNGNVALAAHEAMATIAQQAAEQRLARDASRTFANGLRWFCRHVKEQARSRQVALGRGEVELYDQLDDVGSVCDQWLASLPNSA